MLIAPQVSRDGNVNLVRQALGLDVQAADVAGWPLGCPWATLAQLSM